MCIIHKTISALTILLCLCAGWVALTRGDRIRDTQTEDSFAGVELQYETEEQRDVIKSALNDMLTLGGRELMDREYPDLLSGGGRIGIRQVIQSYFVPDRQEKVLGDGFYWELESPGVRFELRKLLAKVGGNETAGPE